MNNSMPDPLSEALAYHSAGMLGQAALLYEQILLQTPDHPDALHLLGVLSLQQGNCSLAVELISRAIRLRPGQAPFHANLSEAMRTAGVLRGSLDHARQAVHLEPAQAQYWNTLGLAWLAGQDYSGAAEAFEEAVRLDHTFALGHNNLGICRRELGHHAAALEAFQRAVQIDPDLAMARSNLGQQLLEMNRAADALEHCRAAVRLQPNLPSAHNNLGNALRKLGESAQARACYQLALQLQPREAMSHSNLGQSFEEEGCLTEALACYRQALYLAPDSAHVRTNLAGLLYQYGRAVESVAECRQALRLDPAYPEAYYLLGRLMQDESNSDAAEAALLEAVRLRPHYTEAHVALGQLHQERGEGESALASYRAALRRDPRPAVALAALATHLRGRLPPSELLAAKRLLGESLPDQERTHLQFGLAQALDALGCYAEASELLRAANASWAALLTRRSGAYDPAAHSRFVDRLCAQFTPDYFRRVQGWGLSSEVPVFVVGMPRSGTTLVEQILASHPQVFGAGELRLARDSFESLPGVLGIANPACECPTHYHAEAISQVAARHLARLRQHAPTALRIVDKMPENTLYLGLLVTLFPQARIIHCRRDLRDVALSCWKTHFREIAWASDLGHLAARIADHQRLMSHWDAVLPGNTRVVDYEETVADLESVARRMVAWCGLEWDPACLTFHETRRPVRTASVTQVRQPVHRRSVQLWRHYAAELKPVLESLRDPLASCASASIDFPEHLSDSCLASKQPTTPEFMRR